MVELSIVLVIIGLITAGILVGRDLIVAAQMRSAVSNMEKIKTAIFTFKGKYGYLPGDIPYTTASQFGLFAFSGANAGQAGYGDGNGIVQGGAFSASFCSQETLVFWRHLSEANFINGVYGVTGSAALDANGNNAANMSAANMGLLLPKLPFGAANYISVGYGDGLPNYPNLVGGNYFLVFGYDTLFANAGGCSGNYVVTPIEASALDTKMDDGKPHSGTVSETEFNWGPAPANGNCAYGGSGLGDPANLYNVNPSTGGNTGACALWIRF